LAAGVFSSILVHGSQPVFNDIPKGIKTNPHLICMSMADWIAEWGKWHVTVILLRYR
jgi:hypothetical protein